MRQAIYSRREPWLEQLPVLFSLAELRAVSGLSRDAAWQTCRYWTAAGRLRSLGYGAYLRTTGRLECPLAWHLAQCRAPEGYVTGMWALAWHGLLPQFPLRLDMVVRDGQRGPLTGGDTAVNFRRLALHRCRRGIAAMTDGGRTLLVAERERAWLDCLAAPRLSGGLAEPLAMLLRCKNRLRQYRLLDIVQAMDSETVRRRLRVLAENAGMIRLTSWLEQQRDPARDRMGLVVLDPTRPVSAGDPVHCGVRVNLPLALPADPRRR
jgi:predicted transcriptional regulator of viral defense system